MKNSTKKDVASSVANAVASSGKKKGPIKRALIAVGVTLAARYVMKKLTGSKDQPTT